MLGCRCCQIKLQLNHAVSMQATPANDIRVGPKSVLVGRHAGLQWGTATLHWHPTCRPWLCFIGARGAKMQQLTCSAIAARFLCSKLTPLQNTLSILVRMHSLAGLIAGQTSSLQNEFGMAGRNNGSIGSATASYIVQSPQSQLCVLLVAAN